MATKTPQQLLDEKKAQALANEQAKPADKTKEELEAEKKLEASRKQQEEQDRADEEKARIAQAQELLADPNTHQLAGLGDAHPLVQTGFPGADAPLTPAVTVNAGGNPLPLGSAVSPAIVGGAVNTDLAAQQVAAGMARELPLAAAYRTFQHVYANAGTILPTGRRLVFGGPNGGVGEYTTNDEKELEHLVDLARTPGSMVTEVLVLQDGRHLARPDQVLAAERAAVIRDSRLNTAAESNPNVAAARNNLANNIRMNS